MRLLFLLIYFNKITKVVTSNLGSFSSTLQNRYTVTAPVFRLHEKNDPYCIQSEITVKYFLDVFSGSEFFMMFHAVNSA